MELSELPGDICEFCGKDMPEDRMITAKYCSNQCCILAQRRKETEKERLRSAERRSGAICPYCGGAFERKTRKQIYCQISCQARSWYERRAEEPPLSEEEMRSSICIICGSSFRLGGAFRRTNTSKLAFTCSRSCAIRLGHQRNPVWNKGMRTNGSRS